MDIKSNQSSKEQDIFKALFDAAPDAMIIVDSKGCIQMINKQTEELFGYSRNELIGQPVEMLMHEDIRVAYKKNRKVFKEFRERSIGAGLEVEVIRKGGTKFPVEICLSRLQTEEGALIYGSIRNINGRKKLENQLKANNAETEEEQKELQKKYKEALINLTDDRMWSVSRDFKLIACNKAFIRVVEALTGVIVMPGDELMLSNIFPENIVNFWKEAYSRALSGETVKKETHHPAFNNLEERWTETTFNPIYNNEAVIGLACFSKNITERKIAEQRIRENETHLAEARRLAKLGSWYYDTRTQRLTVSEELYNVVGTDKLTFIETHGSFIDLIDAEYREFVRQTRRHTLKTGDPFTIEYHITTKGEKRVVREKGYGQADDNEKIVRFFGTVQDITEQKQVEIKLKKAIEQQSLFESIVNSSDDAIISKTLEGIITSWNLGAEKIFGYAENEAVGKSITIIAPPADLINEERDIVARIKRGENVMHYETERIKKDGRRIHISLSVSPILDSNAIIS